MFDWNVLLRDVLLIRSRPPLLTSGLAVVLFAHAVLQPASGQVREPLRLVQAEPRKLSVSNLPRNVSLGPVIPGLSQGAIPQGLAHISANDWLVISYHFDHTRPSMLGVIDMASGKVVRSITLLERDGSPHMGHVGGLAVSKNYLWVTSGGLFRSRPDFGITQRRGNLWLSASAVYRIPLERILDGDDVASVRMQPWFLSESLGGAATCHEDVLWIAEFVIAPDDDKMLPHHVIDRDGKDRFAWMCGYRLDDQDNLVVPGRSMSRRLTPDYVLVVPEHVQGIAFFKEHIVVSMSLGRNAMSTLAVFQDPRANGALGHRTVTTSTGREVPAWFLDSKQEARTFSVAPMSQGVVARGKGLAMITESGAAKFASGGKGPLDYVVLIEPN